MAREIPMFAAFIKRAITRLGVFVLLTAPGLGQSYLYEIAYDGVTDVNNFSQTFPPFQVEFIADYSQWTEDQPGDYAWFDNAVSNFVVRSEDSVVFQANTGYLDWLGFIGDGELTVDTSISDVPLGDAALYFDLEWNDLTTVGQFTNRTKEFRVPGLGGSIAWNVTGNITPIDEADIPVRADPVEVEQAYPVDVVENEPTIVPVDAQIPTVGKAFLYEIAYNGITDVNDFSQEFPGFQVQFIADLTELIELPDDDPHAFLDNVVSEFVVIQDESVVFQADTGDVTWMDMVWPDLMIGTDDEDHPLDDASLFFHLELATSTSQGEFSNQLKEFRIPGVGGSLAWDITGNITELTDYVPPVVEEAADPIEQFDPIDESPTDVVFEHFADGFDLEDPAYYGTPEPSAFLHGMIALFATMMFRKSSKSALGRFHEIM